MESRETDTSSMCSSMETGSALQVVLLYIHAHPVFNHLHLPCKRLLLLRSTAFASSLEQVARESSSLQVDWWSYNASTRQCEAWACITQTDSISCRDQAGSMSGTIPPDSRIMSQKPMPPGLSSRHRTATLGKPQQRAPLKHQLQPLWPVA